MGAFAAVEQARNAQTAALEVNLWLLRTTLAMVRGALRGASSLDDLLARHPALLESFDTAAASGLVDLTLDEAVARLEERLHADPPGPLQRLRQGLGLTADGLSCFVAAALSDTDPRLAALVDELHGHGGQPTRAMLARLFGAAPAAAALQALRTAGCLLEDDSRALSVPPALWDLACGLPPARGSWRYQPLPSLPSLDDLIVPAALRTRINDVLRRPTPARCWVLRGCAGSGRRALAGALAREAGLGIVEATDNDQLVALGAAATLLGAMPLAGFDPAPGESITWVVPAAAPAIVAVRMPCHGGLAVDDYESCRIDLAPPDAEERLLHWRTALGGREPDDALVSLRLPRGMLHRVARTLPADVPDLLGAVIAEAEEQGRFALDGIARRVPPASAAEPLALLDAAREEFDALVARCRHRDRLALTLPAAFGHCTGVRALFKGPSGTGKTLAARHLAAALQRPLYRVDLAATVSKYIGETERNLERVFAAAESLDIVLLLDEGDALMAGRTGVSNATDRYANLETNYLLQRLEQYAGVLVVTTNAPDRIDTAFSRRMDVTIDFPLPDAPTRLDLWLGHLAGGHTLTGEALERVALRCALSGGQIRNAALHATLLAIEQGHTLGVHELRVALEREYRKSGQQCPTLDEGD